MRDIYQRLSRPFKQRMVNFIEQKCKCHRNHQIANNFKYSNDKCITQNCFYIL